MKCKIIPFNQIDEEDGSLVYMECKNDIPFEIKRVFYIFNTPTKVGRANHANKNTDFVLISINGSCKISVDDGVTQETFVLNSRNKGLYIPQMVWMKTFDFSNDCVLLALASSCYEKNQYYENYDDFKKIILKQRG